MQIFVDILDSDAICICLHSSPLTKNQELTRQMVKQNYYQRLSGKYAILKTFKNVISLIQCSINTVTSCAITVKSYIASVKIPLQQSREEGYFTFYNALNGPGLYQSSCQGIAVISFWSCLVIISPSTYNIFWERKTWYLIVSRWALLTSFYLSSESQHISTPLTGKKGVILANAWSSWPVIEVMV